MMNDTGEDEPSSGLNGRLRPRKNNIPNPQTIKNIRKPEPKPAQDKPKRTTTPSKVSPNKFDDLNDKSDSPALQIFCPYCENSFLSKQAISKHIRNIHNLDSKQEAVINCLFCNHTETDTNDIIRHMVDNHPNQYFACCDCNTRFSSTTELAEHKLNVCENPKLPYRNKLRPKTTSKKSETSRNIHDKELENDDKKYSQHAFNGIVISCELKPSHPHDPIDIEDNITTNLILPPGKSLSNVIEKNAIIVLDDLQWNKRIPPNFSFHNTDADQILSRLGVVHRSPRTGENNRRDWLKNIDDSNQKFEKCFDTSFYSKVASNVQENLTKFLDGSFNFNPDPENTIKTRKAKNSVAINTVEGFPILLASEQFSRNVFDGYIPRTIAPKHKWKWDNLESDKNLMSLEQIKRDSHTNNCIITLVSSLDIWTQLCMRRKFEEKFTTSPLEKRIEKQSIIGQELKEILESRELPTSSSQVVNYTGPTLQPRGSSDFPASLGLVPNPPNFNLKPAVLSGEWVRPRCYVCCACGAQTSDSRALSTHISTQHPNAQIQNHEIVGEVLLNSDILKHLYVPPSQLNNRTRPLRGFRDCTKCRKGISLEDLHQHMLDCAGDTPTVRRKCRYRPFGVRKRRPRLPDNTIRQEMRKDIRHPRHNRKTHMMRPRSKIRSEVGDAETIRKMLADLPAKRHRAIVNPLNPILRPRRKRNKQRSKLVIKKRAIDEVIKKQKSSDIPQASNLNNDERQKTASNSIEPDSKPVQLINRSAKIVASGILSHKKPLNKKNVMNKIRKKTFVTKVKKTGGTDEMTECKDLPVQPLESEHNKQIDQMSLNSNSERININDGSYNARQHGNSSSGSNNRDDQNPGSSGQNNSSRDSFSPSQNVPLKHSIASLTSNPETQDKSVQFHHLFLVQQECNNANQHLPSGQRILFENEAVVTKLDKPPLHFNHSEPLDPQGIQRNKLNKPRKKLNDCIAMLRNKLIEPNSGTLPGHVSVQCGSDEPIGPEPVMIEQIPSTSVSNVETAQRSMQIDYHNKTVVHTPSSYDMTSRVTSRRSSTRHSGHSSRREKIVDIQPNNDFMYWNQFYYNQQILPGNKSSQRYNKRESNRRHSVVSTEELLLQHAMNMEILANSNRNLQNVTDYQFANISTAIPTSHKTPRKNRQNGPKTRSTSNSITKSKNKATPRTRPKKIIDLNSRQDNSHQKILNVDTQPNIKHNDSHFNRSTVISSVTPTTEKNDHYYVHARLEDATTELGVDKTTMQSNVLPEEQLCSNICQNVPVMQYANDYEIHPVHYNMHIESTSTAPLDLSHKTTIVQDSRLYIAEEPYRAVTYGSYETFDVSQQNINYVMPEKEMSASNDGVVDLRVNNNSHLLLSNSTASISNVRSNNLEDNASDYSYGNQGRWVFEPDDCLPTDLSMRRKDLSTDSFEGKRLDTHGNILEMNNMIEDLSHSTNHENDMYIVVPQTEDPDIEEPTDLSIRRNESRSNISSVSISQEQQIHLNVCSNNMNEQSDYHDEEIPADLSHVNNESIHHYYLDEQRMPQYVETMVSNNHVIEPFDARSPQRPLISTDSEQNISAHYVDIAQIPLPPEPRTIITYSEPLLNETQNISTADLVSESSVPCDVPISVNCSSSNEYSHHNDVTFLITDMPLHLSTNIADQNKIYTLMHRESVPSNYEYENTASNCRLIQFQEAEPLSTNTNAGIRVNTSQGYSPVNKTIIFCKSSSPTGHKSETEVLEIMSSSNENNTVPLYRLDIEALKEKYYQTNSDQNPYTDTNVTMIPKELMKILGTMPTNQRFQLFNVLPHYISLSPSPEMSQDSEDIQRDTIFLSAGSALPPCSSNKLENDNKTSENIRSLPNQTSSSQNQILQFVETSPTVISSSILLTPPTPQLSDRHYNQSHENYEVKSIEYPRDSRISTDEQIYYKSINSENITTGSHTKTFHDYDRQDRIIDLTVDDFTSETPDVSESLSNLARTSKDISIVTPISKVLRTNSDKTASLRAVRIKTSSERQRTVLTENILTKKHLDSNSTSAEEVKNKCSDVTIAMAIQQDEISSTLYRSGIKTAATVPVSVLCPEEPISNNLQIPTDKNTDSNKVIVNYSLPGKQNVVTSPSLKVSHRNFRDEIITKDNIIHPLYNSSSELSLSLNAINERSSIHPKKDDCLQPKQLDDFLKDKTATETESLVSSGLKNQLTEQDDDSEDDVTLAVIVQQKQRNLNVSSNEQTLHEKERSRQSVEISLDKLSSHQQNLVLLTNNKTLCTEIVNSCESQSLQHKIPYSCNNTNNFEFDENQTKEYPLKKKGRIDRSDNICGNRNFMEQQEQLCNSAEANSVYDVNKEKFFSEIKNTDVINDSIKIKPSEPSSDNAYRVGLHYDANIESKKHVREDSNDNKFMSTSTDTTYNATKADDSNRVSHEVEIIEKLGRSEPLENFNKIDERQNQIETQTTEQNNISHNIAGVVNKSETEIDDTSTPLRRSRRGKSLFIDSRSILNGNTSNSDNITEHRTPLTKKQLIFSKLLQDEENHNKPILTTTTPDKPISESSPKALNENKLNHVRRNEFNNYDTDEIKCNKRKKSPQSNTRLSKKMFLTNETLNTSDEPVKEVNKEVKNPEPNNKPSDKRSTLFVTSHLNNNPVSTENTTATDTTSYKDEFHSTKLTKKPPEKRKSNSPIRGELLCSKPKKPKLNNEEAVVSNIEHKEYIDISANERKLKISKDFLPTTVATRNTTCYNKAIRRARSKSVGIKSSGTELYDPYDIDKIEDLEDVIDKTESFVRLNVSPKVRYITSKSATAIKTRKLSKTAPSAIINILPSDAKAPVDDIGDNVDIMNITTTEYNNKSSADTKDSSSDSDASSKSDVPLKKYAEEKEKRLTAVIHMSEHGEKSRNGEENGNKQEKSKTRKQHKPTKSINNKDQINSINKTQNEEDLRSEQFMESFGFFSERKPRKSNLLATKRISETFNIENDEIYFASEERVTKKSANDIKEEDQVLSLRKTKGSVSSSKKPTKRGRKKKEEVIIPKPGFCDVCKKVFQRYDNYVRHTLSLYHISRVCDSELKVKTVLIEEEPNYLLAYRQQLNRFKILQNKIAKRKENNLSTEDIVLPTIEEILAEVKRTIREQQLSRRSLSRDEVLFIDCCEMLKESHQNQETAVPRVRQCNSFNCAQLCQEELQLLENSISDDRCAIRSDEEMMDPVQAKTILESEELRNLENDLISTLAEAKRLKGTESQLESSENVTSTTDSQNMVSNSELSEESNKLQSTKQYKPPIEVKDKLYPDVTDNIDMFEDKFDKIKRKCRSQAAAAKQMQTHVEVNASYKNRKKYERKKVNNRKVQNVVPTKAALKGFDGIKVSIQTSDINMSAIVPSVEKVPRKRRKIGSKKKRERKNSEKSSRRESNNCTKEALQKKVDVYEFMDTEDTEVFEFRPSTLMERLKSINNNGVPSTSKTTVAELAEISSESGSDGDDFVYMSDDYVGSDDETENSMLSCELENGKGINERNKTPSLIKKKEVTEKNAVMGKIFKHNAVRTEKKNPKVKEIVKPKANLDQLFDSLLENEPKTSSVTDDVVSSEKDEIPPSRVYLSLSPQKEDQSRNKKSLSSFSSETGLTQKYSTPSPTLHPSLASFSTRRKSITPPRKSNTSSVSTLEDQCPTLKSIDDNNKNETTKKCPISKEIYEPLLSYNKSITATNTDDTQRRQSNDFSYEKHKSKDLVYKHKSDKKKKEALKYDGYDYDVESLNHIMSEDAGVARQRARRKCTVGKQNVLAETWSSESEMDNDPPRPNSAESVVAGSGRKKKGRKKDGQSSSNRKASRLVSVKKHENESRVDSSNRNSESGIQARPRSPPYYWSDGDDEQEHPQQHGWIVGDSHKKLVTMLAHAKGRKRSGDDKRHSLE